MGDETLIGLLHITPKKHPLLIKIKRIGTTSLDRFPVVKLAKVDSDDMPWVHLRRALQTMRLHR